MGRMVPWVQAIWDDVWAKHVGPDDADLPEDPDILRKLYTEFAARVRKGAIGEIRISTTDWLDFSQGTDQ